MLESGSAELRTFRLYTKPFIIADELSFVAIVVSLAAGILVMASVLMQRQLTGGKRAARLGAAWAALLVTLLVVSAPPIAGYVKLAVYRDHASLRKCWLAIGAAIINDARIPMWARRLAKKRPG